LSNIGFVVLTLNDVGHIELLRMLAGLDQQVAESESPLLSPDRNEEAAEIEEALSHLYDTPIRVEGELSRYRAKRQQA
jgi:hypothetical protein